MRMSANIYKLKVKTKQVQLRPMLCRGPVDESSEFTLLIGAVEVSNQLQPTDVVARAEARRAEVIADPVNRRCQHERVNGTIEN
jgi:hypothetical protein